MPNKRRNSKRKSRCSGSGSADDSCKPKRKPNERGPSSCSSSVNSSINLSVSELLKRTNGVLYPENSVDSDLGDSSVDLSSENKLEDSVFEGSQTVLNDTDRMASNQSNKTTREPTNGELMACLCNLDTKLTDMNKRLDSLEEVKKKVDTFDKELRKIWVAITDNSKKTEERINRIEERVESSDFSLGMLSGRVTDMEKQRDMLKDEIVYLQGQSMRSNLVFTGIPEESSPGVVETNEMVEQKVKVFLKEKMKVAEDIVDKIVFDRAHRMGQKQDGRTRKIVAKFHEYKEKEMVRKQWKTLEGTPFYVNEQLPKEVVEKRKRLLPKMCRPVSLLG